MRLAPHPSTPCSAVSHFDVAVAIATQALVIKYTVAGDISALKIPARTTPAFTDGLWKHTCFELFIGNERDSSYLEFNFSPSHAWAAYSFADYRSNMTPLADIAPPRIEVTAYDHLLELTSTLSLAGISLPSSVLLSITAVLERTDGAISYWALKHPASKPDFHHRDGFVEYRHSG